MDVLIYSPLPLFGECLERCLEPMQGIGVVAVVQDEPGLRAVLERLPVDLLLVDVSQGLEPVAAVAVDFPGLATLAVGLPEQEEAVVRCGRLGFAGYVPRDASLAVLHARMLECVSGRLSCPDEIAAGLLRALRGMPEHPVAALAADAAPVAVKLSAREIAVARLLRRGYANKEIARELGISVATVKHHVHSILEKLELPGRVHVARAEPDRSWGLDEDLFNTGRAAPPRLKRA